MYGGAAYGRLAYAQEGDATTTTVLIAAGATFAETGEAATFQAQESSAFGSFALTGEAANLQQQIASGFGSFTETGEAATFQDFLAASAGTFALSGQASFQIAEAVGFGTFNLTGIAASFGFGPLFITDTDLIELPINCILAGQQDYEVGHTEIEARDPNIRTRTAVSQGGGGRLSSSESSFRVRKDSRGYD